MAFKYITILVAVALISLVQIIVKARLNGPLGEVPSSASGLSIFIMGAFKDPYLWGAGVMLLVSAFLWYFSISRLSLGVAFAFASLAYPLVMIGSQLFLGESFVAPQYIGCLMIVAGLCLIAYYS